MLVDTVVFIDLTRGYKNIPPSFRRTLYGQSTSTINRLELIVGLKTRNEIRAIDRLFKALKIIVLPINEDISKTAEWLVENYFHSHGLGIEDALIAATALANNEELVTRNRKHFQFIPNLKLITPY